MVLPLSGDNMTFGHVEYFSGEGIFRTFFFSLSSLVQKPSLAVFMVHFDHFIPHA